MKKSSLKREPLTDDELWFLTADQFLRLKLTDAEKIRLREINKQREIERSERSARIEIEETEILADLKEVGWDLKSVWSLSKTSSSYSKAIPILLKHLLLPYLDVVKEGIARALAAPEPEVQKAWPLLVDEYRKAPMGWGIKAPGDTREYQLSAKDGLASALSAAVTDKTLPELIALAKDRTLGDSRILLLSALKKRRGKNALVQQAIAELVNDSELQKEIASWKKR